jgi:cytochrome P450
MPNVLTEPHAYPAERAVGCPFDPPPAYRTIQDEAPVSRVRLWDGNRSWLVTRYVDQRTLLADPRLSADTTNPAYPIASASSRARLDALSFLVMDDPGHARLRRMVTAPFAVKRVEALRPAI